jgi:hypothetical protein
MKLVKNLLLLAALVLGLIFIKNKFFSKHDDSAVQTEQPAEETAATSDTQPEAEATTADASAEAAPAESDAAN